LIIALAETRCLVAFIDRLIFFSICVQNQPSRQSASIKPHCQALLPPKRSPGRQTSNVNVSAHPKTLIQRSFRLVAHPEEFCQGILGMTCH
jgi:hypothetical protein